MKLEQGLDYYDLIIKQKNICFGLVYLGHFTYTVIS